MQEDEAFLSFERCKREGDSESVKRWGSVCAPRSSRIEN